MRPLTIITVIILASTAVGIFSCEKITDPYDGIVVEEPNGPDTTDTTTAPPIDTTGDYDITYQSHNSMLVEEFTGMKCSNCPPATEWIKSKSKSASGDNYTFIAYHVSNFAVPDDPRTGSKYTLDLRTTSGEKFYNDAGSPGEPAARFQRTSNLGFNSTGAQWDGFYNDLESQGYFQPSYAEVNLGLGNIFKDGVANLTVSAQLKKSPDSASYKVVVVLLEDGIIGNQKDPNAPNGYQKDYEFNLVYRAVLSSSLYGDAFYDNTAKVGDTIDKQYTLDFSGKDWNPNKCRITAFIVSGNSGRVITAYQQKLNVE